MSLIEKMSDEEQHSTEVSPIPSPVSIGKDQHDCPGCEKVIGQPKVLSCLHVFCKDCLQSQLDEETNENDELEENFKPVSDTGVIVCKTCQQETPLPSKKLDDLMSDYVLEDVLEALAIDDKQVVCTSCKAKETAVARCTDCASFLCANCVTAHQFMRCFENHKVTTSTDVL